jgi:hypothetical protein
MIAVAFPDLSSIVKCLANKLNYIPILEMTLNMDLAFYIHTKLFPGDIITRTSSGGIKIISSEDEYTQTTYNILDDWIVNCDIIERKRQKDSQTNLLS